MIEPAKITITNNKKIEKSVDNVKDAAILPIPLVLLLLPLISPHQAVSSFFFCQLKVHSYKEAATHFYTNSFLHHGNGRTRLQALRTEISAS